MKQRQRFKLSQKRHIALWRETVNGSRNDSLNHSYHAKAIAAQAKRQSILTKKEKKAIYAGLKRGRKRASRR